MKRGFLLVMKALEALACAFAAIIVAVWIGCIVAVAWTWWRTS